MFVKLRAIAETRLPEIARAAAHPAERVNAVSDVADGHIIDGHVKFLLPHFATDRAVELANSIGGARGVEREHGHAKLFSFVVGIQAAHRHQFLVREIELFRKTTERIVH